MTPPPPHLGGFIWPAPSRLGTCTVCGCVPIHGAQAPPAGLAAAFPPLLSHYHEGRVYFGKGAMPCQAVPGRVLLPLPTSKPDTTSRASPLQSSLMNAKVTRASHVCVGVSHGAPFHLLARLDAGAPGRINLMP